MSAAMRVFMSNVPISRVEPTPRLAGSVSVSQPVAPRSVDAAGDS